VQVVNACGRLSLSNRKALNLLASVHSASMSSGYWNHVSEQCLYLQHMLSYWRIDVKIVDPERPIGAQGIESSSLMSVMYQAVKYFSLTGIAQTDRSKLYAHQKKRLPNSALYGSMFAVRLDAR
jgi:hypothetical protein